MKIIKILAVFVLFVSPLYSQWTSNTNLNTVACDTTGEQSVQKQALCSDGSTYYGYFDNRGGSYAVYLQKLDVNGIRQFGRQGILISNNAQNSSLVDWDMIADNNNNCILVFTDVRNGGSINPFAYMVSPTGTMMWGANGVQLSDSLNAFQPNPHVVQTTDNNFVFMWRLGSGPTKIALQKLNSSGIKQWGVSPLLVSSGTTENYDWVNITPSDNGNVICSWSAYTGSFISPQNYKIYSQKFSTSGTRLWNATEDTVYSLGKVSGFYNPRIFSDGLGGAIYVWRDDRNNTGLSTGYVQRQNASGAFLFPVNGSAVSQQAGMNHFDPQAAYMPATGETVAFFYQSNSGQTLWGFSGQKFSATGAQMWGVNGINYIPLGNNQQGIYTVRTKDTNAICYFNESQFGGSNNLIKAFRVGSSGAYVWSGGIVTASSILSPKIRINAVIIPTSGMSIVCWQDQRNDGGGIYTQNINFDGTFGGLVGVSQTGTTPQKFSLEQNYPNPFNPSTQITFSIPAAGVVSLQIYNMLGQLVETPVNEFKQAGTYKADFNLSALSSGVYFYKLQWGKLADTKKMVLIK